MTFKSVLAYLGIALSAYLLAGSLIANPSVGNSCLSVGVESVVVVTLLVWSGDLKRDTEADG